MADMFAQYEILEEEIAVVRLSDDETCNVILFLLNSFVQRQGTLTFTFFDRTLNQLTNRAIAAGVQDMNLFTEIKKTPQWLGNLLQIYLKKRSNALSLATPLDALLQEPNNAFNNKVDEIKALTGINDFLLALDKLVNQLMAALGYLDKKHKRAQNVVKVFEDYQRKRERLPTISLRVSQGSRTHEEAVSFSKELTELADDFTISLGNYFKYQPPEVRAPFVAMLIGPNEAPNAQFNWIQIFNGIRDNSYSHLCSYVTDNPPDCEDIDPFRVMWHEDLPRLEKLNSFKTDTVHSKKRERVCNLLKMEIQEFLQNFFCMNTDEEESKVKLQDGIYSAEDLIKRYRDAMCENEELFMFVNIEVGNDDQEQWSVVSRLKQARLVYMDHKQKLDSKQKTDYDLQKYNREQVGKSMPRRKIMPLKRPSDWLAFVQSYQKINDEMPQDLREGTQMVLMLKEALHIENDKRNVAPLDTVKALLSYLHRTYISSGLCVRATLSPAENLPLPVTIAICISNCEEILRVFHLLSQHNLMHKVEDAQLMLLENRAMMYKHKPDYFEKQNEFLVESARLNGVSEGENPLTSTRLGHALDEIVVGNTGGMLNLSQEVARHGAANRTSLKREFFKNYITRRLPVLRAIQESDAQTKKKSVSETQKKANGNGNKNLRAQSYDHEDSFWTQNKNPRAFNGAKTNFSNNGSPGRFQSKAPFLPCPMKCKDGARHPWGALSKCKAFRDKNVKERRDIAGKTHCCKQCVKIVKHSAEKPCPAPKCKYCGAAHHHLLCESHKKDEGKQKCMKVQERKDEDEDDDERGEEEEEEDEESENNHLATLCTPTDLDDETTYDQDSDENDEDDDKEDGCNDTCAESVNLVQTDAFTLNTTNCLSNRTLSRFESINLDVLGQKHDSQGVQTIEKDEEENSEEARSLQKEAEINLFEEAHNLMDDKNSDYAWQGCDFEEFYDHKIPHTEVKCENILYNGHKTKTTYTEVIEEKDEINSEKAKEKIKEGNEWLKLPARTQPMTCDSFADLAAKIAMIPTATREWGALDSRVWKMILEEGSTVATSFQNNSESLTNNDAPVESAYIEEAMFFNEAPLDWDMIYTGQTLCIDDSIRQLPEWPPPNNDLMKDEKEKVFKTSTSPACSNQSDKRLETLVKSQTFLHQRDNSDYIKLGPKDSDKDFYAQLKLESARLYKTSSNGIGMVCPAKIITGYTDQEKPIWIWALVYVDTGATTTIVTSDFITRYNSATLSEKKISMNTVIGHQTKNFSRNILSFLLCDNTVLNVEGLRMDSIGIEKETPSSVMNAVASEFGMTNEQLKLFYQNKNKPVDILLGGKAAGTMMNEVFAEQLSLKHPSTCPNMRFYKTPFYHKLIMYGWIGINAELFSQSYPIFLVHKENMNVKSILPKHGHETNNFENEEKCAFSKLDETCESCGNIYENLDLADPIETAVDLVCFLTQSDSENLQQFLDQEKNTLLDPLRCSLHQDYKACQECLMLNNRDSLEDARIRKEIWDNLKAEPLEDGKFKLRQTIVWSSDPTLIFTPQKSNRIQAENAAKSVIRRLYKLNNNSLSDYIKEVKTAQEIGTLRIVNGNEKEEILNGAHSFCNHSAVTNEQSRTTSTRLVNNTSTISTGVGTTISLLSPCPKGCLNDQQTSLTNWLLYKHGYSSDVSKCYRRIACDTLSSRLRMFAWYEDIPTCSKPVVMVRDTMDFGDSIASYSVEAAEKKFIKNACELEHSKTTVDIFRYADNNLTSTKSIEEYHAISRDIEQAHERYSMPLKFTMTSQLTDKNILKKLEREDDPIELLLGVEWDLRTNKVRPHLYLSIHKKIRGKSTGPKLKDDNFDERILTRHHLSRLVAQLHCVTGIFLSLPIFSGKVILSRSCEIASLVHLNTPLYDLNPEFAKLAYLFVSNLKNLDNLLSFDKELIPENAILKYIVGQCDGGLAGYGGLVYLVSKLKNCYKSNLIVAHGKIQKRSIPAHECLARLLNMIQLSKILHLLTSRPEWKDPELTMYCQGDSVCTALSMSPQVNLKNTLIRNALFKTVRIAQDVTRMFPKVKIHFTWIPTHVNAADPLTKFIPDPIPIMNSNFYRHGHEYIRQESQVGLNTFMIVSKGNSTYYELPEEVTGISSNKNALIDAKPRDNFANSMENCNFCSGNEENCGRVFTRNMKQKVEKDKESHETEENQNQPSMPVALKSEKHDPAAISGEPSKQETAVSRPQYPRISETPISSKQLDCNWIDCGVHGTWKNENLILHKKGIEIPNYENKIVDFECKKNHGNNQISCSIIKINPKIKALESLKIRRFGGISSNRNLLDVSYKTRLVGTFNKDLYRLILSKLSFNSVFGLARHIIQFCLMKYGTNNVKRDELELNLDSSKETWEYLLRTSQQLFPPKLNKSFTKVMIKGIMCNKYRLDPNDAIRIFGTEFLPILSTADPLVIKLTRFAHQSQAMGFEDLHNSTKQTIALLKTGNFGINLKNMKNYVNKFSFSCAPCNQERELHFTPKMGPCYSRIKTNVKVFSEISADLIGPYNARHFYKSRTVSKIHILAVTCINFGCITAIPMDGADSRSIILALLRLQTSYNQINLFTSDAGSVLQTSNLDLETSLEKQKFFGGMKILNHPTSSQYRNYAERHIKILKRLLRIAYGVARRQKFKTVTLLELDFILLKICLILNACPYQIDVDEMYLSPLAFMAPHTQAQNLGQWPMPSTRFEEVSMAIKNMNRFTAAAKLLRDQQIRRECSKYQEVTFNLNSNFKKNIEVAIGDLVMVSDPSKFEDAKIGVITKILNDHNVEIKFKGSNKISKRPTSLVHPLSVQVLNADFQEVVGKEIDKEYENEESIDQFLTKLESVSKAYEMD